MGVSHGAQSGPAKTGLAIPLAMVVLIKIVGEIVLYIKSLH